MIYLDTSAAIKTLILVPESETIRALFAGGTEFVSSRLLAVELHAVADRRRMRAVDVRALLERITIISLDDDIAFRAIDLRSRLRTLDSLHLATALALRQLVTGFLSYDAELNAAAQAHGIPLYEVSA